MELKVICSCGQKYKFDVEPVNGRMPFTINCPACGADGTQIANGLLAQMLPPAPPAPMPVAASAMSAPPPPAPAAAGLRINREVAPPPIAPPIPVAAAGAGPIRPAGMPKYMKNDPTTQTNSFMLGTLGAFVGAVVAVVLMVSASMFLGFRFPLFGTIMGAIIGFGAKLFYRGTDSTLGGMAAVVALITISATLYLMFGVLGMTFSFVSIIIGVAMAFKIASG
jgi:hypothetical protein